jgi:hypothetical protein
MGDNEYFEFSVIGWVGLADWLAGYQGWQGVCKTNLYILYIA